MVVCLKTSGLYIFGPSDVPGVPTSPSRDPIAQRHSLLASKSCPNPAGEMLLAGLKKSLFEIAGNGQALAAIQALYRVLERHITVGYSTGNHLLSL